MVYIFPLSDPVWTNCSASFIATGFYFKWAVSWKLCTCQPGYLSHWLGLRAKEEVCLMKDTLLTSCLLVSYIFSSVWNRLFPEAEPGTRETVVWYTLVPPSSSLFTQFWDFISYIKCHPLHWPGGTISVQIPGKNTNPWVFLNTNFVSSAVWICSTFPFVAVPELPS